MTSPRGHGLPKKKPSSPAKDDIDAELPELELIADDTLPVLEPVDEQATDAGLVNVSCAPANESGFDVAITVVVPAMDKKAVAEAVQVPLQRVVDREAAGLRFVSVLVRFTGEAMVGSAIKELVAGILKPKKPKKVTVRRGFGDEMVHVGTVPALGVETKNEGTTTRVTFATGELDAADLASLLPAELKKLAAAAKGRKFVLTFQGNGKPDAALREVVSKTLLAAGAVRAAIGERVLFDTELASRVQVKSTDGAVVIRIDPAADGLVTQEALQLVLHAHQAQFAKASVRVQLLGAVAVAERDVCVELVKKGGASRIEIGDGKGEAEVVWPKLVHVLHGDEVTLRVQPSGRRRAAVLKAFRAEVAELKAIVSGKTVVVEWPAGFSLDAEVENELAEGLGSASSVLCTLAGEFREPFLPPPVLIALALGHCTVRLDTHAGKPVELVRAIERRVPAAAEMLRGQIARVQLAGSAAPSRTLLRTLCGAIEATRCARLEIEDRGQIDVLLPPLLTITQDASGVRIAAVAGGRDAAQLGQALQRELDAAGLKKGISCTVSSSSLTDQLVAALVGKGVGRVVLDGTVPVQLHPPLLAPIERRGDHLLLRASPGEDAAIVEKQIDRELPALLATQAGLPEATMVVHWPGAREPLRGPVAALVSALIAKHVGTVLLEDGAGKAVQVHPPIPELVLEEAGAGEAAPPSSAQFATATAAVAVGGPNLFTVLARKDDAAPPMLLLGVAAGNDGDHLAAVRQQLQSHLPKFRGRCVMLVLRSDGRDVPVRRQEPLVDMLGQLFGGAAAVTMVFRGPDAQGRPHFQVLHSTLRATPRGAIFADPRTPR